MPVIVSKSVTSYGTGPDAFGNGGRRAFSAENSAWHSSNPKKLCVLRSSLRGRPSESEPDLTSDTKNFGFGKSPSFQS
eukprot:SAG31_NODE_9195_length_1317_cov_2.068144_2_plen_78_part_00